MTNLIFYTTDGCHLCEQAEVLLQELLAVHQVSVEAIDISCDEDLVERYGIRIPVVKNRNDDREVGWPFGLEDLINLF